MVAAPQNLALLRGTVRMRRLAVVVGMVLFFVVFTSQSGRAEGQLLEGAENLAEQEYVADEIIVKFKPGVPEDIIANLNSRHGTSLFHRGRHGRFNRLRIAGKNKVAEMVERYRKNPNIEYVEPNYIAHAFWKPGDALYPYQWNMDNPEYGGINAEEAWDIETGAPRVIVAVVDTGVAYENYVEGSGRRKKYYYKAPDFARTSFVPGYDFVNNDTHPNDDQGHGTHVAGTVAQSTDNGTGTAGVAFNCSVMPVKVLGQNGSGTYSDIADGIMFAADNGAQVINLSLGGPSNSITLKNALAYAYDKGVTIVCASGNNGSPNTIAYPAAYDEHCITVGATRYDETVAYYSNRGLSLDLVAPGGDLKVDQNGDGYGDGILQQTFGSRNNDWGYWFFEGTSMAAPHVSGVAALVIAHGVAITPDEVREALQSTAKDKGSPGWDPDFGYGIVDASAALTYSPILNDPPVADAGGPYTGTEDEPVAFDGSGSADPDGTAITYFWNFGDGNTSTAMSPTHTYTAGGTYDVTLVVNDGRTSSAPSTTKAVIYEVNDPPVADAGPNQTVLVGDTLTFNGSKSADPDGLITSYAWDFGDGTGANGMTTSHAYSSAGPHTVRLTVTDDGGLTATDMLTVTVIEAPQTQEVLFTGTVPARGERRHPVVIARGAATLNIKLTWNNVDDLRLRVYAPDGRKVAERDKSTNSNRVEEILINFPAPGVWTVAPYSESRSIFIPYTIAGAVNYRP